MEYVIIIIAAVFVSNIVLNQFLGICPFIGVSSKVETAIGMTGAVTFVMVIATLVTYLIYHSLLAPFDIVYMRTITFILVIASLVQLVEIILKKISPPLYQALGIFLPLITTNSARPAQCSQKNEGSTHRLHRRRTHGPGLYGLCRYCLAIW